MADLQTAHLRGVGVLGQALVLGIKALRFSAEEALAAEDAKDAANSESEPASATGVDKPSPVSSWLIAGNLVLALGREHRCLFIVLPLFLTRLLQTQTWISKLPPVQCHRWRLPRRHVRVVSLF